MTEYSQLPDADGFDDGDLEIEAMCDEIDAIFATHNLGYCVDSFSDCEVWVVDEHGNITMCEPFGLLVSLLGCKSAMEVLDALQENALQPHD